MADGLLGNMVLGLGEDVGHGLEVAGLGAESEDRVGVGDSLSLRSSSNFAFLIGTSSSSLSSSFAVNMAIVLFNFLFFFSRASTFFCHTSSPP